jgi:phosphate transport system substrate-binding protein
VILLPVFNRNEVQRRCLLEARMPETSVPSPQDGSKAPIRSNEIQISFRLNWNTAIATVAILIAMASALAVFNARRAAARAMALAEQAQKDAEQNKTTNNSEGWTIPVVPPREAEPKHAEAEPNAVSKTAPAIEREMVPQPAPVIRQAPPVQYGERWSRTPHELMASATEPALTTDTYEAAPLPVNEPAPHSRRGRTVQLLGAGSTYANPIMQKWAGDFRALDPELIVNYQSIGSGAGFNQLTAGTVDFSAIDSPLSAEEMQRLGRGMIHVPVLLNAVVPIYNLPTVMEKVRFSPEMLAGIFLGKITRWTDPIIAAANPGVRFPDLDIHVVHRSDSSSDTYILTDYLSRVSPDWANIVNKGASVIWTIGLGGKGNSGVADIVKQEPGAVGYVNWQDAAGQHLSSGSVRNAAGLFVSADSTSLTQAAASVKDLPADLRFTLSNAPGLKSYPITGVTFLLARANMIRTEIQPTERDASEMTPPEQTLRQREFFEFVNWMLDGGQQDTKRLNYAPLPQSLAIKIRQRLFRQEQASGR